MISKSHSEYIVKKYGNRILGSEGMQKEKKFCQHGKVSVYEHSLSVAILCVQIAAVLPVKVNIKSLVQGALLHDYFLYDWHIPQRWHRLHGFHHARCAHSNAKRDFALNEIEENMILSHMFPLNLVLPKYKESMILCIADKVCALQESVSIRTAANP